MASRRNLYAVLNVAPDAEPVVIEAAYRALMKKYHPDQAPPPEPSRPSAADINAAFAVLRNPQKRADYDHRERTRTQAIQLAQFQAALPPPPPRQHSRVFGWGGWLVALVLAGALGLIASRSGSIPPMVRLEAARAAPLPDPDLRSQPAIQPVSAQELAQIRADAYVGHNESAAVSPPATEESNAAAAEPSEQAADASPASQHEPARPSSTSGKDSVERHGGIY